MVKKHLYKEAFTLIELIFAIVIIAISVMTLPMMAQVTSSAMERNLIQEAIFVASAQLNEATTYTWDERSTDDLNVSQLSKVVNTNVDGCSVANNRPGNINRECLTNLATRPSDAPSVNGSSIDSVAYTTSQPVFIAGSVNSADGYKQNYKSTLIVTRCDTGLCTTFGTVNNNENLKQLEYKIIDPDDDSTLVLLRAYSANIGELEPYGDFL